MIDYCPNDLHIMVNYGPRKTCVKCGFSLSIDLLGSVACDVVGGACRLTPVKKRQSALPLSSFSSDFSSLLGMDGLCP